MKISKLCIKSEKTRPDEGVQSMDLAFQGGLIKRFGAGIYGLGHFLTRSKNKIVDIVRKHLDDYECVEVSLPVMQPKSLWVESGRWQRYIDDNEMFHFKGRGGEYCIAPTAEEVVFDFAKNNLSSYKNLNVTIYQFGEKYRDEMRARGGLLRSKEFLMKDAYSFDATREDMSRRYGQMRQCYIDIFNELGIQIMPARAINGAIGGKKSEEFMMISEIGGDRVMYNEKINLALNEEVLENAEALASLKQEYGEFNVEDFKITNTIELGHIFELEQNYSKSMNGKFTTADGKTDYFYMGCYGLGVTRTLGALLEKHCDEMGLVFPCNIAPYNSIIVSLFDEKINKEAEQLYKDLKQNGIETLWDDRDLPFGQKIKDANLWGIPNIIIMGNNFLKTGEVEVENRKTHDKQAIKLNVEELLKILEK